MMNSIYLLLLFKTMIFHYKLKIETYSSIKVKHHIVNINKKKQIFCVENEKFLFN